MDKIKIEHLKEIKINENTILVFEIDSCFEGIQYEATYNYISDKTGIKRENIIILEYGMKLKAVLQNKESN